MAKTKIKIFNVTGERGEVLRTIDSAKSWSTNGTVLKASYLKNQKAVSITTTLPYLVEESESDESGLNINDEVLKNAARRR